MTCATNNPSQAFYTWSLQNTKQVSKYNSSRLQRQKDCTNILELSKMNLFSSNVYVKKWTGLNLPETHVLTKDRVACKKLVKEINGAPTTNNG